LVSLFDFASEINFFYLTNEAKYFVRKNKNFFCACSEIFRAKYFAISLEK